MMPTSLLSAPNLKVTDQLLKRTTSRCPICHGVCPAEVWRTGGIPSRVLLKRACPDHGETNACIASDARFYWLAKGKAENSCCGSEVGRVTPCAPSFDPSDSGAHGVRLSQNLVFGGTSYTGP